MLYTIAGILHEKFYNVKKWLHTEMNITGIKYFCMEQNAKACEAFFFSSSEPQSLCYFIIDFFLYFM